MAKRPRLNLGCILKGIVVLLIPIAGAVAGGYGTWVFFTTPYTPTATQWYPSSPLPAKAIKILGTLRGDLVVQANDGGRYRYTCWPGDSNPACWRKVEIWEGVTPLQDISEEPIFTAPNPPGKAVDSVAVNSGHELLRQTNYAVLEDGSVWVWDYANLGTAAVVFLVLAVLGAAASYVIGSIVSFVIAAKL